MILSMLVMASMVASTPAMDIEDFTINDVANAFSSEDFGLGTEKTHCKFKWIRGLWIKNCYARACCAATDTDYNNMMLLTVWLPKKAWKLENTSAAPLSTLVMAVTCIPAARSKWRPRLEWIDI